MCVKLFKNLTSGFRDEEFFMFLDESKFCEQVLKGFEKEHSSEIISKSDSGSREEKFLRISSCSYSAISPIHQSHSPESCLCENIFQNLTSGFREEEFLRIFSCLNRRIIPHSLEPCLPTEQNLLLEQDLNRVTQGL